MPTIGKEGVAPESLASKELGWTLLFYVILQSLSITNSTLIIDNEFSDHAKIKRLLARPDVTNLMLYPSEDALPLEQLFSDHVDDSHPTYKPLVFWVLDTTWSYANKMLRLSPALRDMPKVAFEPDRESTFRIRRQPHAKCLSTIESIFLVIDRWQKLKHETSTDHHSLMTVFHYMVNQQLNYGLT